MLSYEDIIGDEKMEEWNEDVLHEECGVFGVYKDKDAAFLTYYGLHALQHRGQEGAGIVTSDGMHMKIRKRRGLVSEVFHEEHLKDLQGIHAIGHVRYATAGGSELENVQPLYAKLLKDGFAVCHNGQIINAHNLRKKLEAEGSIFQGSSDSEIILHLIQKADGTFLEKIKEAFSQIEGAFAVLVLTKDSLYAIRDAKGLRPLSFASLNEGVCVSSETCAFQVTNADYIDDVAPGEIIGFTPKGMIRTHYTTACDHHMCAMEYVYFSRPDSELDGINVHNARKRSGMIMAKRDKDIQADIVVGVPDSSTSAAIGYAERSRIPFELGLIKNRYVGRTFIKPTQEQRERGVKMKLSAVRSIVADKNIVLIDDSIVRGTTSKRIIQLLKEAGAHQVHVRIASPPICFPCIYGVDTSSYEELISARMNVDELCAYLGADSLRFLDIHDMKEAFHTEKLCCACFNGAYVTDLYDYQSIIERKPKK